MTIEERRLEDLRRLNRLERRDEKPFEVVAEVSAPDRAGLHAVRAAVRPAAGQRRRWPNWGGLFHPLRVQRWALSDLNPLLWPLPALASAVKAGRRPAPPDNPYRQAEKAVSDVITAGLDLYRDLRDAAMEALFFQIYGGLLAAGRGGRRRPRGRGRRRPTRANCPWCGTPWPPSARGDTRGRGPDRGSDRQGRGRIPLARLELVDRFIRSDEVLSQTPGRAVSPDQGRAGGRRRAGAGARAAVAAQAPRRPGGPAARLLALLDKAVAAVELTPEQQAMLERVRGVLGVPAPR